MFRGIKALVGVNIATSDQVKEKKNATNKTTNLMD